MTEQLSQSPDALLEVDVQYALASDEESDKNEEPPSAQQLAQWANIAYQSVRSTPSEITIRLVAEDEITVLNRDYRTKDKPTNVLSFAFEIDPDIEFELLGDIVICHPVIVQEAREQNKSIADHYAHMVTHGVLHLCGYDHEDEASAAQMEGLETRVLASSNIADPYC